MEEEQFKEKKIKSEENIKKWLEKSKEKIHK